MSKGTILVIAVIASWALFALLFYYMIMPVTETLLCLLTPWCPH